MPTQIEIDQLLNDVVVDWKTNHESAFVVDPMATLPNKYRVLLKYGLGIAADFTARYRADFDEEPSRANQRIAIETGMLDHTEAALATELVECHTLFDSVVHPDAKGF